MRVMPELGLVGERMEGLWSCGGFGGAAAG